MSRKKKIIIAIVAMTPILIIGALLWYAFLSPLANCVERGGMYVEESRSCVCSNDDGLFVCSGKESEATSALIEEIYKNQLNEN